MKYKYDLLWIDRVDEDRWITAFILSVLFLLIVYFTLSLVKIPVLPQKPKVIEEIEFVKEEVQKKIVQSQQQVPQEVKKEVFEEEEIDVTINVFQEYKQETNFPQEFTEANRLQITADQDPSTMPTEAITRITAGEFMEETEDEPLETNQGFNTEWEQDFSEPTVIITGTGENKIDSYVGPNLAPKSYNPDKPLSLQGFKGVIKWEDYIDPTIKWVLEHSVDIGKIIRFEMARDDKTIVTAKAPLNIESEKYQLYIACKQEKRMLTICLVSEKTDEYIMLIDQGLTKMSTYLKVGQVRRDAAGNIVRFSGEDKTADDPLAKKYMAIFWSWAESISK